MDGWYYKLNGDNNGPVSKDDIHTFYRQGLISDDTLVWSDGIYSWRPYCSSPLVGNESNISPSGATQSNKPKKSQKLSIYILLSVSIVFLFLLHRNRDEIDQIFPEFNIFGRSKESVEFAAINSVNEELAKNKADYRCSSVILVKKADGSYEGILKFSNGRESSIYVIVDKSAMLFKWDAVLF